MVKIEQWQFIWYWKSEQMAAVILSNITLSHTHTHTHARTHTNELLLCVTLVVHATGSRAKYCQKYFRSDQLSSKYKDDRSSEDIKTYGQHIVALIGCDVRGSLGLPVKPEKQNNDESLQLQIAPPMCDTLIWSSFIMAHFLTKHSNYHTAHLRVPCHFRQTEKNVVPSFRDVLDLPSDFTEGKIIWFFPNTFRTESGSLGEQNKSRTDHSQCSK